MIVDVALPLRIGRSFHYKSDELHGEVQTGCVVEVPFKNQMTHGFVVGVLNESSVPEGKLKTVGRVLLEAPLFDEKMLEFFRWVSRYYNHPLGEVIATAIPKQVLESPGEKGGKRRVSEEIFALPENLTPPTLTEEQQFALARIFDEKERPILLHGVTGSGKTEVYLRAVERVLGEGKGAIVLVPEIALTPLLVGRFSSRFPDQVAIFHSELTQKARRHHWDRIQSGAARVVVGARSAVFAPVKQLGLMVVDEEHETSFKQEDSLRYHARDMAIVRGRLFGAKVILGSATPSVESYFNAESGKYLYVTLKKRVQDRALPKITFVDMKDKEQWLSPGLPWISRTLVEKIHATLRAKQQVMLYLNRLGFANFLYCADCGETWRCRQCDVSLTYYEHPPILKCHYCSFQIRPPTMCGHCQGTQIQRIGIGTERLEKELVRLFPNAVIARMDRSQVKTKKALEAMLTSIAKRQVDILIGTQMVTKGHDFPGIALVGIILADASLNLPDFRANERTFQIVTQVSGRAGRAEIPGEVVLQTLNPGHPVLALAAEQQGIRFYQDELGVRRRFGFPPFKRLTTLRFQHRNEDRVRRFSEELTGYLRKLVESRKLSTQILGPAQAPLSKLKNQYRWQSLLKCSGAKETSELLDAANEYYAKSKSAVQFSLDVDPIQSL